MIKIIRMICNENKNQPPKGNKSQVDNTQGLHVPSQTVGHDIEGASVLTNLGMDLSCWRC